MLTKCVAEVDNRIHKKKLEAERKVIEGHRKEVKVNLKKGIKDLFKVKYDAVKKYRIENAERLREEAKQRAEEERLRKIEEEKKAAAEREERRIQAEILAKEKREQAEREA